MPAARGKRKSLLGLRGLNVQILMSLVYVLQGVDRVVRNKGFDGEGCIGCYGSISWVAQAVVTIDLVARGLMSLYPDGSSVVDFGAGTGRALLLWYALGFVERAFGYEFDKNKVEKADAYLVRVIRGAAKKGIWLRTQPFKVEHKDVCQVSPEELAQNNPTLGYTFCAGMNDNAFKAMGELFGTSPTMKTLLLVGRSKQEAEYLRRLEAGKHKLRVFYKISGLPSMGNKGRYTVFYIEKAQQDNANQDKVQRKSAKLNKGNVQRSKMSLYKAMQYQARQQELTHIKAKHRKATKAQQQEQA